MLEKFGGIMNKHFFTKFLLLMGSLAQLQAATWYVSPTGNNGNSCSAPTTPCQTIDGAYQKATGGDTIQMAAGSYAQQTVNSKAPASDIVVQPATGASVRLNGLTINGATRLEIRDLTTGGFNVNMNSNYVTLRNVTVNGGLFYMGGSNISMIGGSVGPGVDYHPQIAPNNGWQGQGVNFVFDGVDFHDWTRTGAGVHTECLQVAGTTNMIIRNSTFRNCAVNGLQITEYNGSGAPKNMLIENNWFDSTKDINGTGTGSAAFNWNSNIAGTTTVTARFNSSSMFWIIQPTNAVTTLVGNIINGGAVNGSGGCHSGATYSYNITPGEKCGATDIDASPGFVNAGTVDLRLTAGSPAINFVPLSVAGPATDMFGSARPQGSGRDAGAHEFPSGSPPNAPTALKAVVQ